jgi:thiamine pyrophosphate-dependent acetolactate synthase large subunit-like protein
LELRQPTRSVTRILTIKTSDAIARVLRDEGVDTLVCYPRNPLIDPCVQAGLRPIICRAERTGVHIADGISRASNGRTIGVFAPQGGPGIENSFPGVAQSFSDSTPILILSGPNHARSNTPPSFSAVENFAHVTVWSALIDDPQRVWEIMRRAFHHLRNGKRGPVLLELSGDVASADCGEYDYRPAKSLRSAPDRRDVRAAADLLLAAENPVIHAGQGILWSEATPQLVRLAELLQIPVLTTNTGKSGFPEDHPLSLGAMVVSGPQAAFAYLNDADCLFAAGASLTKTPWGPQVPNGKRIVHLTANAADIDKEFPTEVAMLGDAALGLEALIAAIGDRRRPKTDIVAKIAALKAAWRAGFAADFASDAVPINHYRILRDLHSRVDPQKTIITHEAGSPREQAVPFWPSVTPRDYLGWGKSTQLGASLGMIMGAKIAQPDKLCINLMGDASIGMVGMDIETAVRCKLGILTVVFNNGVMYGEKVGLEEATAKFDALDLGGDYRTVAAGLGAWSTRVDTAAGFLPALDEALAVTTAGRPALIEIMAKSETHFSRPPFAAA